MQEFKFSWIIPLILTIATTAFIPSTLQYNGYDFSFSDIPILCLPIYGTLAYPIAKFISALFSKLLGINQTNALEQIALVFFVGFSAFIGSFFASNFGVLLISIGFISYSFYRQDACLSGRQGFKNTGIALLFLSMIHYFMHLVSLETADLSFGKTIEGIFFGGFAVLFVHTLSSAKKHLTLALLFGIALTLFVLFGLLMLHTQKTDLGGMDAFVGSIVGISLALVLLPEFALAEMIFGFVIAGGIFFGPMIINQEEKLNTKISINGINQDKSGEENVNNPFDLKGLPLDSIIGVYRINEKTVQLNFRLGPNGGVTKGALKSFSGKVNISSNVLNSSFTIELPLSQLTTFNKIRDESLMEDEYFQSDKYPTMSFTSNKLQIAEDGYEINGTFKMLGVSNPLTIKFKYIGMFESYGKKAPVLVGKSSIDRTLFGMTPDSKEGNIVEFEFKVELMP